VTPEVFAEWLRRQRLRVVRTASSWWYEAGWHVYQAFPYHWLIRPQASELDELFRGEHALALRCTVPFDAPEGCVSYHAICEDRAYDLDTLHANARRVVRQGLQRAEVGPIPMTRILEEGWALELDTCRRQGRSVPTSREVWRRSFLAAAELPGFEGWGALVEGHLAAYSLCVQIDDCWEVLLQRSASQYLNARVNNALTFAFTRSKLRCPEVRVVFFGVQSLDAPASVDEFKFRMGYTARPVRQLVAFHGGAVRAVGPSLHRLLLRGSRRYPASMLLAKAEGMVRFHLQGKLPPEAQEWPECLHAARCATHDPRQQRPPSMDPASLEDSSP
jgi:hypothetical protein